MKTENKSLIKEVKLHKSRTIGKSFLPQSNDSGECPAAVRTAVSAAGIILSEKEPSLAIEALFGLLLQTPKNSSALPLLCEWIFDFLIICGHFSLLPRLCEASEGTCPMASDFAVYEYIRNPCREKLLSVLDVFSEYKFRKSSLMEKETELYEDFLFVGTGALLENLTENSDISNLFPREKTIFRSSFRGLPLDASMCPHIEISYIPFSENGAAAEILTGSVKHCENLLRRALGNKTKLAGINLTAEQKKVIFSAVSNKHPHLFAVSGKAGRKPKIKLEELPKKTADRPVFKIDLDIDFEKAKNLEEDSWEITRLLSGEGEPEETSVVENKKNDVTLDLENVGGFSQDDDISHFFIVLQILKKTFSAVFSAAEIPLIFREAQGLCRGRW